MLSALGMVLNARNTVAAAMSLVVTMVALAVIYLLLEAHLVARDPDHGLRGRDRGAVPVRRDAANLRSDDFAPGARAARAARGRAARRVRGGRGPAALGRVCPRRRRCRRASAATARSGIALYTDYVLLVEMASLLLTAAIVGALILAKRKID